jgi:hypothetical protein
LRALGPRGLPVVARGDDYVMGQSLRHVDEFLGLEKLGQQALPPAELVQRLDWVLAAAQRYLRQIPEAHLHDELPGRPRSFRTLGHHIFQVPQAFLDVAHGTPLTAEMLVIPPGDDLTSFDAVARHGQRVRDRLADWWQGAAGGDFAVEMPTYYGEQTLHELLERTTWHAAQHARQLLFILGRMSIEPDGPIGERELAGLPLPEGIWDG